MHTNLSHLFLVLILYAPLSVRAQCTAGTSSPNGQTSCTTCPANTYSYVPAVTSCTTCSFSNTAPAGSGNCFCSLGMGRRLDSNDNAMAGLLNDRASPVAMSSGGTVALVGAPNHQGGARAYAWSPGTSTWVRRGVDADMLGVGGAAGSSVALSADGSIALVGAPAFVKNTEPNIVRGIARAYRWTGSAWTRLGTDESMVGLPDGGGDVAGQSVALSSDGTIAVVGAPNYNTQRGTVRAYKWNPTTSFWDRLGTVDSDMAGLASGERVGGSLALSADGTIVLLGVASYSLQFGYSVS